MKITLISYHFPPDHTVASRRVMRIAKSFLAAKHEVLIYTYSPSFFRASYEASFDKETNQKININKLGRIPVNLVYSLFSIIKRNVSTNSKKIGTRGKTRSSILIPDWQIISIIPILISEVFRLIKHGRSDIIIASGPLFSSFVIAKVLASINRSQLVLDYRDPWVDSDYRNARKNINSISYRLENWLENKILSKADLVTTVSTGLAKILQKRGAKNIQVAYNLLSPVEYNLPNSKYSPEWLTSNKYRILHSGSLYGGKRDPSPLLDACSKLNKNLQSKLQLIFLGPDASLVRELSFNYELGDIEIIIDSVSYEESRLVQSEADLLLLLNWKNTKTSDYVITAKVFEYIATGNKILTIGSSKLSELVKIIESSGSGSYIDNSDLVEFLSNEIYNDKTRNNNTLSLALPSVSDMPAWTSLL